ncbi:MltR family transcriptional regulator [Mucilaginibacter sp. AW1-7]|uniref:MltR family transcriptional regulator n=1 Tax=Mucilaginibacter sp. AW1-7 TaxID=3349874 RepID=UPI003F731C2C
MDDLKKEQLANFEKSYDEFIKFRSELSKETDRGVALMAAALLDYELELLIKTKMLGTSSFLKDLFEFNGPLGTFSAKIKIAYSIGLISKETKSDLDLIRKIRNEFGHQYTPISFESTSIAALSKNLKEHMFMDLKVSPRRVFINVASGIVGKIQSQKSLTKKFDEHFDTPISDDIKNDILSQLNQIIKDKTDSESSQ